MKCCSRKIEVMQQHHLPPGRGRGVKLAQNNISSLLAHHVSRDSSESARDPGVDRGVDDTQTSNAADAEARVQDGVRVVVGTNGHGGGGVVAPSRVLGILADGLGALDVRAGENLGNINELAGKGIAGEADGLGQGGEVGLVVAGASIEVVEGDLGDVERVGGLELHGAGVVARVGLEDGPGEPVVLARGVDAVTGEVATEVDGPAEDEGVPLVVLRGGALVVHGGGEAGGRVQAMVAQDGVLPALEAFIGWAFVEGAAIQGGEVVLDRALDRDLVMVLKVGSNTRRVDDDGDAKLLELVGRTDSAELQDLRGVVDATGNDDLAGSCD